MLWGHFTRLWELLGGHWGSFCGPGRCLRPSEDPRYASTSTNCIDGPGSSGPHRGSPTRKHVHREDEQHLLQPGPGPRRRVPNVPCEGFLHVVSVYVLFSSLVCFHPGPAECAKRLNNSLTNTLTNNLTDSLTLTNNLTNSLANLTAHAMPPTSCCKLCFFIVLSDIF